jgi:hypothetical protein
VFLQALDSAVQVSFDAGICFTRPAKKKARDDTALINQEDILLFLIS